MEREVKRDLKYLSLGAGANSSCTYVLSCLEQRGMPRVEAAIFADTQNEPQWVYDMLDALEAWGGDRVPIYRVTAGNLGQAIIDRHNGRKTRCPAIPAFSTSKDSGKKIKLQRHCTTDYKSNPIEKEVRRLMGYKKYENMKNHADAYIGMGIDEVSRASLSKTKWITNHYPLIDAGIGRIGCMEIVEAQGLPRPKRSACVWCPFHGNKFWIDLQNNYPEEFQKAVEFDAQIRDMSASGIENPVFLHRDLLPLDQVQFNKNPNQMELFDEECGGYCGV